MKHLNNRYIFIAMGRFFGIFTKAGETDRLLQSHLVKIGPITWCKRCSLAAEQGLISFAIFQCFQTYWSAAFVHIVILYVLEPPHRANLMVYQIANVAMHWSPLGKQPVGFQIGPSQC